MTFTFTHTQSYQSSELEQWKTQALASLVIKRAIDCTGNQNSKMEIKLPIQRSLLCYKFWIRKEKKKNDVGDSHQVWKYKKKKKKKTVDQFPRRCGALGW